MRQTVLSVMLLSAVSQTACALPEARTPEDLIQYIHRAEAAEIRESWGEQAGECFTWDDLDAFVRNKRPATIASDLKSSRQFGTLASMIGAMPKSDRDRLLARARNTARPTWAMIGGISREGTTEAGRRAGLLLAGAIVDAMGELLASREGQQ
jgi:hypothetical protein